MIGFSKLFLEEKMQYFEIPMLLLLKAAPSYGSDKATVEYIWMNY